MVERRPRQPNPRRRAAQRADDAREEPFPGDCGWRRVIFASDCDEDGDCPVCGVDYAECDCPGPTQDDMYEYREDDDGILWARRLAESDSY